MTTPGEERPPLQDRSRRSWDRVLLAGTELVAEKGWEGLTITEVCRRAGVSATSVYARVDGKAGLFLAVHERQLSELRMTEDRLIDQYVRSDVSAVDAATAAARVILGVFDAHGTTLHSLIDRSAHDEQLLERGGAASRRLLARLAETIPLEDARTGMILKAVFADCVMRLMYGPALLGTPDLARSASLEQTLELARTLAAVPAR